MSSLNNVSPAGSEPSLPIQDEAPSIGNMVDSKIQRYEAQIQKLSTEIKNLKSDHKATETLLHREVWLANYADLRANKAQEKIKALQDDYTELNKDHASLYNKHRDLMSDHATLKRDHALLEAGLTTTNRNLATITTTVDHIARALSMQNVGSHARLGSDPRSSVLVNILEKHTVLDNKLDSVNRKVDSQLEETKKVVQDQEQRLTKQFTEHARVIDDRVFKVREMTDGITAVSQLLIDLL
jgi:chromosome segregation ATPase